MTKKQMKKLAKRLYDCEIIHQSPTATKEEKQKADNLIMQISNQIMCLPDGISTMLAIDAYVEELITKGEKVQNES